MKWNVQQAAAQNARRVLPRLVKRYLESGRAVAKEKSGWKSLHQFRLDTKRFRYTLELFEPVYGPGLEKRMDSLRRMQQMLGEINDLETMLSLEAVRSQQKLVAWLKGRRRERRKRFRARCREAVGARAEKAWIDYLTKGAR